METKYQLYDVEEEQEGKNHIVRVLISSKEGINIDDCINVNKQLVQEFDKEDIYSDPYMLEVASPGIERTLKEKEQYLGAIGEIVNIKTNKEYQEFSDDKTYQGELQEVNEETLIVDQIEIRIEDLEKVKTVFIIKKGEKK